MKDLINRIKAYSIDNKLVLLLLTGMSVFLLVAYLLAAFRSYVNADAGYYLGTVELIHQGYVPYRDFSLGYTPLFFYALQIPRMFMGTYPVYYGYMLFLYLIVFADALLMALIVRKTTKSVKLAWLSGLVFLVLYYYLEGVCFILEAFSVCFGLASIIVLWGEKSTFWRMFLAGLFSALSFLSKQYGLLFAGVIGIMLLLSDNTWKKKLWNCLSALLGFCTVIALFFLLFFTAGLRPDELVEALSGSGYGGQSVNMYIEGVARSVRLFPFLIFIPCLFMCKNKNNTTIIIGCLAGLLMASLQFYFNVFSHYFIYMIPFVLVLNALLWKKLRNHKLSSVLFWLYFGMLFTAVAQPTQDVYKSSKALVKHNHQEAQTQTATQLRQIIQTYGCKSVLCYWNTFQYYGLCPLKASMIKKYGFSFGYDTEETYCERLQDADCLAVRADDIESLAKMSVFYHYLINHFSLIKCENLTNTVVYVRNE